MKTRRPRARPLARTRPPAHDARARGALRDSFLGRHPRPSAGAAAVLVAAVAVELGGPAVRLGAIADAAVVVAIVAVWPRLSGSQRWVVAGASALGAAAGWIGPGPLIARAAAQLGVAAVVAALLSSTLRPRRRPQRRPGIAAEVRTAMVEVGLARKLGGGQVEAPTLRGGAPVDETAPVVQLSWRLPATVSPRKARDAEEALSHRLGAEVRVSIGEDGAVVTEIRRARLARVVSFADFYRQPAPAGDLVTGVGTSRGGAVWLDFGVTAHVLVAGLPGEGKSAAERQVLTRLALQHGPEQLRLALIDVAKMGVEFDHFGRLPHAFGPVATNVSEAIVLLDRVLAELDRRWRDLRQAVAEGLLHEPNIRAWRQAGMAPWPRIVVAVDELAELTTSGDKRLREMATDQLEKVARIGRAAGAHLLLATQRPDADAVPGQLRGCVDGALAFRVANAVNSRVVLDNDRAAYLPEVKGRALWKVGGSLEEVQGVFISAGDARGLLERGWGLRPASPDDQAANGSRR